MGLPFMFQFLDYMSQPKLLSALYLRHEYFRDSSSFHTPLGTDLREKCPNTELFWFEDLGSKSPYSVRIWENTDQKKLRIWTLATQ